ncbi:dehydrodolichyl diphosphate synthase complex subunit NUS1 [Populus alba x Populus x berolinensis]|uniref:ditrans,polycis-polyprenyl diphosphate synthase [(2E,6E)-farnesyldiphosphate specific] n=1 Tax=Populus alba x Populus x berolinensis TaxID=444605 RepID=A0AAD6R2S0_9ROSI|nr:dehydrodolichyl diphosphate synthase complex subunit NUS1 [Populus alba x Populus x berolinensis]
MDLKDEVQRVRFWIKQIGNFWLRLVWHSVHLLVRFWYLGVGVANVIESYLISSGLLKRYRSIDVGKLRYLAIVIESDDACRISKVIQLLQWLQAIGVKHLCLYDTEGVLKKSKESILAKLKNATLFEEADERDSLLDQKHMTLEFASISDGKEAVAKGGNVLFMKYLKMANSGAEQKEQIFTEANMTEALRAAGFGGPEPDLLLVYGPARCHLGFPAWRIRYTEIVHMGPLKSVRYGSLVKAIYKFTTVQQKYGKFLFRVWQSGKNMWTSDPLKKTKTRVDDFLLMIWQLWNVY